MYDRALTMQYVVTSRIDQGNRTADSHDLGQICPAIVTTVSKPEKDTATNVPNDQGP